MSNEFKITDAIFRHLDQDDNGTFDGYKISFPGYPFEEENGALYLRAFLLPGTASTFSGNDRGSNEYPGILQVDVMAPADGKGQGLAITVAGSVCNRFRRGTKLRSQDLVVNVIDPPYTSQVFQEPSWLRIAVTIPFMAYAKNPA